MTTLSSCQQQAREAFKDFLASGESCFILTGGPGRESDMRPL